MKQHSFRQANLSVSSTTSTSSIASLASTSSATSGSPTLNPRRGLVPSPPLSPSLPSLIHRHGKKQTLSRFQFLRRVLLATALFVFLVWFALRTLFSSLGNELRTSGGGEYEMVSGDDLPRQPAAVVVHDERGRQKWTLHIPQHLPFPLRPAQYAELCLQAEHVAEELSAGAKPGTFWKGEYYAVDPRYVDVGEAQQRGLLLSAPETDEENAEAVCERSLTYVMETKDAGMGNTLLGLWTAYGLARKEGRAFFVDDTRWPYGNYTAYFAPPPQPPCRPAPPSHRVPCPRSAAHLVISAATFDQAFGAAFEEEYVDSRRSNVNQQQRHVFSLARAGYEALFKLSDANGDAVYVEERAARFVSEVRDHGGLVVGMHVRRGDVRPWEMEYREDYLPLARYMDEARQVLIERIKRIAKRTLSPLLSSSRLYPRHGAPGFAVSRVLLASDDPDVYAEPEVSRTIRAQDRIMLASKRVLEASSGGSPKKNKWIDEVHGWEGGFFRDVFWGLGRDGEGKGWNAQVEKPKAAMRMREMIGRAYLLDLAVLARGDAVVCAVSAAGCRALMVMMGWERGVEMGEWRNVDHGAAGWMGVVLDK
ncbi:hypothetical protein EJ06DRAFT_468943 [Trichodelitschia bisporula]|uniref:Uncharacterized protein n=1 Tax=Trichodelitschia bisporula TaxID=703511 RepID=A0A6G1IB58_9PEZI|nr:hypothetical protein EJ06DRAFT_468943 [Trichodelitschia bisporula]